MLAESTKIAVIVILFLLQSGKIETVSRDNQPVSRYYDWHIVNTYPHDPEAFTQGLIFRGGYLYESTGRRGESSLRKTDLETGEVLFYKKIDDKYFAEGLADRDGRLIQLTLSAGIGFIYNMESFELERTFTFRGQGWGLANDSTRLVMSDGTSSIRFLDPESYEELNSITVTENGQTISGINELEIVDGRIYANLLYSDEIIIINPEDGIVTGRIDLQELVSAVEKEATVNVLNGIAYDSENDRLFVTGKLWPKLFEIEIVNPDR